MFEESLRSACQKHNKGAEQHDPCYPRITKSLLHPALLILQADHQNSAVEIEVSVKLRLDEQTAFFAAQFAQLKRTVDRTKYRFDGNIFLIGNALLQLSKDKRLPPGLLNECICDLTSGTHVQTQSMTGLFCLLITQLCNDFREETSEWIVGAAAVRTCMDVEGYHGDWEEQSGKDVLFCI